MDLLLKRIFKSYSQQSVSTIESCVQFAKEIAHCTCNQNFHLINKWGVSEKQCAESCVQFAKEIAHCTCNQNFSENAQDTTGPSPNQDIQPEENSHESDVDMEWDWLRTEQPTHCSTRVQVHELVFKHRERGFVPTEDVSLASCFPWLFPLGVGHHPPRDASGRKMNVAFHRHLLHFHDHRFALHYTSTYSIFLTPGLSENQSLS